MVRYLYFIQVLLFNNMSVLRLGAQNSVYQADANSLLRELWILRRPRLRPLLPLGQGAWLADAEAPAAEDRAAGGAAPKAALLLTLYDPGALDEGRRVGEEALNAPPRCPCACRAHPADARMRLGAEPRGPASDPKR
jgi:hypothetical protein